MRFFDSFLMFCGILKKRMLSVDAPTAEMALDCNSLNKKSIFLICTAIQAR